jgi:RNA polymerase sigma-32 factor
MNAKFDRTLTWLIARAACCPILSKERELEVALAWRKQDDRATLEELVGSHLRLVIKIARRYAAYEIPIADLGSEGNVGLT